MSGGTNANIAGRRVTVSAADRRLTASFAVAERGGLVVERGGTLREGWADTAAALLVAAFAAACARAGREEPDGLHVRAVASIPEEERVAAGLATALAGAAGANALLGLGMSDEDVASAGDDALRGSRDAALAASGASLSPAVVEGARITVRQSCPD